MINPDPIDLTETDTKRALDALPDSDRVVVAHQIATVEQSVKALSKSNGQKVAFGPKQAEELIAKLGIWMAQRGTKIYRD